MGGLNAEAWVDALIERYVSERIFDGRPDAVLRANLIKDVDLLMRSMSVGTRPAAQKVNMTRGSVGNQKVNTDV